MKKSAILACCTASLALLMVSGCAPSAPSAPPASSPGGETRSDGLGTADTPLGTIIVDGEGMTVYIFDEDTADSGVSACEGSCATQWPAVLTSDSPPEVEGITGNVDTITTDDGMQVTINGLPLYRYVGDTSPGDTTGQGVGGIWWVVDPSGDRITEMPAVPGY